MTAIVRQHFEQSVADYFFPPIAATCKHAEEIADIVNRAFSESDIFRKSCQKRTSAIAVKADMDAGHTWYIMEHGEKIRKVAVSLLYVCESEISASIHMLATDIRFRKLKKGAELLAYAEKVARQQGKIYISISVAHINERLIKYYETCGYAKTGLEKEYFPPDQQKEYLIEEFQGYNGHEPKLKCVELIKKIA